MSLTRPPGYSRLNDASGTTLTDGSRNGHNGKYGKGVTLGVAGAIADSDTAISQAGATTDSAVAHGSWMNTTTAQTLECWVRYTSAGSPLVAMSRASSSSQYNMLLYANSGKFACNVNANKSPTSASNYNDGA